MLPVSAACRQVCLNCFSSPPACSKPRRWFVVVILFCFCFLLTEQQLKATRTLNGPEPWKACVKLPWLNLHDQPWFFSRIISSMKNHPLSEVNLEMGFKIPVVRKGRLKWASLNTTPNVPNSAATVLVTLFAEACVHSSWDSAATTPLWVQPQKLLSPRQRWQKSVHATRSFKSQARILITVLINVRRWEFMRRGSRTHLWEPQLCWQAQGACGRLGAMPPRGTPSGAAQRVWRWTEPLVLKNRCLLPPY